MDLKPVICPYCGREMELDDRSFEGHGFWYTCDCGASTPFCKSEEEANQCASKAAQPKWISVEERLPEQFETVIACTDKGTVCAAQHWGEAGWKREMIGCCRSERAVSVTHWMPLPEPAEEQD